MTGEERIGMSPHDGNDKADATGKRIVIGPSGPSPLLTYASTCCAVLSVLASAMGNFRVAVALVVACGVLDAFDGRFASKFERDVDAMEFGKGIDSLSDAVAFGMAPAALAMSVSLASVNQSVIALCSVASCLYVVACIHRLAWYGVLAGKSDGRPDGFRGVPVTYASLAFLVVLLACTVLVVPRVATAVALAACEFVMGFLFVLDVAVPRPGTKALAALSAIGIVLAVVLLLV